MNWQTTIGSHTFAALLGHPCEGGPPAGGVERGAAPPYCRLLPFLLILSRHGGPRGTRRADGRGSLRRLFGAGCQHQGGVGGGDGHAPRLRRPLPPGALRAPRRADVWGMRAGMGPGGAAQCGRARSSPCGLSAGQLGGFRARGGGRADPGEPLNPAGRARPGPRLSWL